MQEREMSVGCTVKALAYGPAHHMRPDVKTALHAYVIAITIKNLSPLLAAKRLFQSCSPTVGLVTVWDFDDGTRVEAGFAVEVSGEAKLTGGGMSARMSPPESLGPIEGVPVCICTLSWTGSVQYGPRNVLQWIANCVPSGVESLGTAEDNEPRPNGRDGVGFNVRGMADGSGRTVPFVMEP